MTELRLTIVENSGKFSLIFSKAFVMNPIFNQTLNESQIEEGRLLNVKSGQTELLDFFEFKLYTNGAASLNNVTILSVKEMQIDFQMTFSDTDLISTDPLEKDQIEVMKEQSLFLDAHRGTAIVPASAMIASIPR